jgi:hypothetical protein
MSSLILIVFVLLVGAVAYVLLQRLVTPVRVVGACVPMVLLTVFILNMENLGTIIRRGNPPVPWPFTFFFERHQLRDPNPNEDPELTFQSISKEDYEFLDQILAKQIKEAAKEQRKQTPGQVQDNTESGTAGAVKEPGVADLVSTRAGAKRSEAGAHKETVKRAQLVIHNEIFKRAELVRSREQ